MDKNSYKWRFRSVGGAVRVDIQSGEDIAHLDELDRKMWTVLSCPVSGLEFDSKTLALLDADKDGKIRVDEVIAAAKWLTGIIKNPDLILKGSDTLPLSEFNTENPDGDRLLGSAKQILENLCPLPISHLFSIITGIIRIFLLKTCRIQPPNLAGNIIRDFPNSRSEKEILIDIQFILNHNRKQSLRSERCKCPRFPMFSMRS